MKTIITGLLSKAYNMDSGKIAELFKDGENELSEEQQTEILNKILEADTQRVDSIKKNIDTKPFFQDGFKKAQSEVLSKFESDLKTKFGVESDKMGQDLVDFIVQEKTKKSGGGTSEDEIKRSKTYLDLETKWKTDFEKFKTDSEKEKNDIINGYKKEKVFSDISQKAMTIFNGLNPVLPTNKQVADNQINNFVNSLKGFDFDIQDERIVVMDKEGKVIQDKHGNSRSFDDIVKSQASGLFEFKQNNGGSGSGNGGGEGGGSGGGNRTVPKTYEELEKIMNDRSIPIKEREDIIAEYEKAQKGI